MRQNAKAHRRECNCHDFIFSFLLTTSDQCKPGKCFCFHDLIITVHVWSAECVPKLDEKGLVTAQCGSDVLAPHWQ